MHLKITRSWNGEALPLTAQASVEFETVAAGLIIRIDAPFHHDPPPPGMAGSTDCLWNHEVVEIFLLGSDGRYLEIELNPHGHYLVLQFAGIRNVLATGLPIGFAARIAPDGARWSGTAEIPRALIPAGLHAANAYTIHGEPAARHHAAAFPVPGEIPDFHQPDAFGPCVLSWPRILEHDPEIR